MAPLILIGTAVAGAPMGLAGAAEMVAPMWGADLGCVTTPASCLAQEGAGLLLGEAGEAVSDTIQDAFTNAMLALWGAALWCLKWCFGFLDRLLTPDLSDPGLVGSGGIYALTLWLSMVLALVMGLLQIAVAAVRRDGQSLGSVAIGVVQYGAVVAGLVGVAGVFVQACSGLTEAILEFGMERPEFAGYPDELGFTGIVNSAAEGQLSSTTAAVLGVTGFLLLIPAVVMHFILLLVREAALIILFVTMPIAAAGALREGSRAWLWKALRWFLACSLMGPLLALVLVVGVQIVGTAFQNGPQGGGEKEAAFNVGMALSGSMVLLMAGFVPVALFRLLAFVDPGTSSGAAFRGTMSANGGLGGLLQRGGSRGSGAATETAADGRSASEAGAETKTASRFASGGAAGAGGAEGAAGAAGAAGGPVGAAVLAGAMVAGKTMHAMGSLAQHSAAMMTDVGSSAGFSDQSYYDVTPPSRRGTGVPAAARVANSQNGTGVANDPAPPQRSQTSDDDHGGGE